MEECCYTCIVPIGSLEPHGHHMPVGTDYFTAKAFSEQAAEIEPCMVFSSLNERKNYTLFFVKSPTMLYQEERETVTRESEGRPWGHGCEWEASLMMHLTDDVDLSMVPDEVYQRPQPPEGLDYKNIFTGVEWYARAPMYYVGNPNKATAERGKRYTEMSVNNLAAAIKNVKENTSVESYTKEYYDRMGI